MRIDIKSKNKFSNMLQKIFNNIEIPVLGGCSIDSRDIHENDLFLPIKGTQFDGHDFINDAIQNGACLVLSEKAIKNKSDILHIDVKSVIDSIKKIATQWRDETDCEIIGITGSNGKTSTKEILNKIISKSSKSVNKSLQAF